MVRPTLPFRMAHAKTDRPLPAELRARFVVRAEFQGGEGWTWLVAPADAPARSLVLKVLDGPLRASEASVLASLDHPRIPRVVESGVLGDGRAFLVREFVAGEPLHARFPFDVETARACAVQILEVLAYVHLRGILHLDLKPANVVAAVGAGTPRYHLLDFGLARRGEGQSAGGTPFFVAPEVILGLPASPRSDLFSLGALLVAALDPAAVRTAQARFADAFPRTDFFAALGVRADAFQAPFDRVLPRLLGRRPQERCADAQEALELLTASSGRPSVTVLDPDPIAAFGADLEGALAAAPAADLELCGGDADDRRALALHAVCVSPGVERIEENEATCRLVRTGTTVRAWRMPRLDAGAIAAHLQSAVGLDAATARGAATELAAAGADTPAALRGALQDLLERGRIVPHGMRWLWPDAAAGRVHLDPSSSPQADDIAGPAAQGRVEAALAAFQRRLAADPRQEAGLRTELALGYLQGGEPGRALPLAHDLPLLRTRALLDLGRVAEAAAALQEVPDGTPGVPSIRAALAAARGDFAGARAAYEAAGDALEVRVALGGVLVASGEHAQARAVLRGAIARLDATRPFLRAAALTNLAEVERVAGDAPTALALHGEALTLLQGLGQVRYTAQVSSNLGVVAKDLGRLDEARVHLRRARAMFQHLGDARGAALADANLGIASLEAGDAELAVRRLSAACDELVRLGHREWLPLVRVFLARALALGGDTANAQAQLDALGDGGDARVRGEVARVRALLATRPATDGDTMIDVPKDPGASSAPAPPPEGWIPRGVFRSFLAVNRRLASEARLDRAMEYLLEAAVTLAGARTGLLLVVRRDGVRLELRAGDAPPAGYAFSRSLVHRAIQQRRALTADEALADRDLMEMPSVRGLQVKSVLCVPFVSASGTEGALYVEHPGRPGAFGALEKEHLEVLADQAAIAVDRMLREEQLAADLEHSRRDLEVVRRTGRRAPPTRLLGDSAPMRAVKDQIRRLAAADISVLVLGETGTGKELVARSLHEQSAVAKGPFVSVNCAAIAPDLMESELFGHVRGAFTGADDDRVGLMELASGGTLFLDEIGDMPLPMQASLLRALQEGRVRPVGSGETRPVAVRVVAATHRDVQAMIGAGGFRGDLYYRIAGAEIALPPLRARGDDVLALADELLARVGAQHRRTLTLTDRARRQLREYRWPGNVRELEHVLARAAILSDADAIDELNLPADVGDPDGKPVAAGQWPVVTLREAEERTVRAALAATGGEKTAAAKLLGISRTALYDKLKRMGDG